MKTIKAKLEDSQNWKGAKETLADFKEMMELIRKYPIRIQSLLPYLPYTNRLYR